MKRKVLSFVMVAMLMLSVLPASVFAEFRDTKGHWAQAEIEKWNNNGIILGSDEGFRPNAPITRGEMAVILDKVMKYQINGKNSFADLDNSWYTDSILKANAAKVILGSNNTVRPKDKITREEAAVMFTKALGLKEKVLAETITFKDSNNISNWAKGCINALVDKGYIKGDPSGNFKPKSNITRAEVVIILDNSIKELYSKEGTYSDKIIEGSLVINTPAVNLKNVEIKGNIIIAEGVGEGEVKLDNVKISGDTIVKGGGENSVYFNNVTVGGALIVNKVAGNLRIVVTGTTSASVATLESGAILVTKDLVGGGIEKVEIPANIAAGQNVVLIGNFKNVENNASNIAIQATGKIENLVLNKAATVTGGAEVKNITAAQGADSVVNNTTVKGGSTPSVTPIVPTPNTTAKNTDSSGGSSSGGSSGGSSSGGSSSGGSSSGGNNSGNNNSSQKFKVTFDTNGGSVVDAVYTERSGTIILPADPIKADVTFLGWYTDKELTSKFSASTPVTSNITLYAKWTGWQKPIQIDSRFAEGYPKSNLNESDIELKVKLKGASAEHPMEVFMVVNQANSHITEIDSTAVIHGHGGNDDHIVYVDQAPYIMITDENEHTISTGVNISGNDSVKIYFVVKDATATSQTPTMVEYTKEAVAELDHYAPSFMSAYINNAKNQIMLYFNEKLDTHSVPNVGAFTFSGGSVIEDGPAVSSVSITNDEKNNFGQVKLLLNKTIEDISGLQISYNDDKLKDLAAEANIVKEISENEVENANLSVKNVYVSNNGKYITMEIDKCLYVEEGKNFNLTLKYGNSIGDARTIREADYQLLSSWAHGGSSMDIHIELNSSPVLTNGNKYFITIDANGLKDYAGDLVPELNAEGVPAAEPEESIKPSSVEYNPTEKNIKVKFDNNIGLADSSVNLCFMKLFVDDKEYVLRRESYIYEGRFTISQDNIPFDMEAANWSNAKITYSLDVHPDASVWDYIQFKSGIPYSGFEDFPITTQSEE